MDALFGFIGGIISLVFWLAIVVAVIAFWGYNKMRHLAENVKEAWANISVVTRKKIGMVNQLIDVAKSYENSEKLVMLKISSDQSVSELQSAFHTSGTVLSTINGMAQRFPDLKSNEQYRTVMEAMQRTEADLERARLNYNAVAKEFNVARTSIPHAFYAPILGFTKADYLEMEAFESGDASFQRPMVSDDGQRLNVLLGSAGKGMMGAAKSLAEQGKVLAEQGKAQIQARMAATEEFHYLDAEKTPKGPVSRVELDRLFEEGQIAAETDVLPGSSKAWTKYASLGGGA
ncbi:MAG: LemA family protein [Bryobacteraceae bacterium]